VAKHMLSRDVGRPRADAHIYHRLVAAGATLDSHESDLYVRCTPETDALTVAVRGRTVFRSAIDGAMWFDLPFCYLPWWENRAFAGNARGRRRRPDGQFTEREPQDV
jgi:hypothetical protein